MLFYRAALPLSRQTLTFVSGIIRRHRMKVGSRWRKLNPGQQALLVLAYLRKGETFAELAAGFGVGTTTAWRYVNETVACSRPGRLSSARRSARRRGPGYAYVVVDGTLILVDPGRRGPAVLLRKTSQARDEPAGNRESRPSVSGSGETPGATVTGGT